MKAKNLLAIIAIAAIFTSCQKGDTGPAGQNGVANIKSNSLTLNPTDWVNTNTTNWDYTTSISIPSTDVCEVYVTIGSAGNTPLPTITLSYLNGGQLFFYYQTGGNVVLHLYNTAGTLVTNALTFNIVDIPPAVQIRHPNTNWGNPTEVLQLPEVASVVHN
jgi:hypothetical protein